LFRPFSFDLVLLRLRWLSRPLHSNVITVATGVAVAARPAVAPWFAAPPWPPVRPVLSRLVENNAIFIRHCGQKFYTKEKKRNITCGLIWKSFYGFQPSACPQGFQPQTGSVASACPSSAVTLPPSKPRLPQRSIGFTVFVVLVMPCWVLLLFSASPSLMFRFIVVLASLRKLVSTAARIQYCNRRGGPALPGSSAWNFSKVVAAFLRFPAGYHSSSGSQPRHATWYCSVFELPRSREARTSCTSHSGSPLISSGGSGSPICCGRESSAAFLNL